MLNIFLDGERGRIYDRRTREGAAMGRQTNTEIIAARVGKAQKEQIEDYVRQRSTTYRSVSQLITDSIEKVMNEDADYSTLIFRRLNSTVSAIRKLDKNIELLTEIFMGFTTYYFQAYPPFTEEELVEARKQAHGLFMRFTQSVRATIRDQGGYLRNIKDDLIRDGYIPGDPEKESEEII
jgi:23S rRNA C2498 (ribose-2'-O)-methylase RlmM